ncbi:MFS transporter [Bacillus sp. AFS017336]|uniref:MFS transporter n=1 Tax=Bacillus sp. AFS017336 TaxID=2033489 RepID=UPI00211D2A08|nr:MFS transporter [Bacillus sp. AFS017336]
MNKTQKRSLWALSTVPLVMTLGNSMLIPVLPKLEQQLNISGFKVSMIITVYSVFAIILIPIAGYLSDLFGRKKVIIPSLIIAGIGGTIAGWVCWKLENPYMWLIVGRIVQGIGSAGAMPVVIPCVGDMFKDEKEVSKGLGLVETSNTFGKVLSPILGSVLAAVIWFLPFLTIPLLCLISIILILLFVKPPKQQPKGKKDKKKLKLFIRSIRRIFRNNGKWLYTTFILGAIIMFVLFGMLFYLSSILEKRYQIIGILKGCVLAIPLAALSYTSYKTGKKIGNQKEAMKKCIVIGFILISLSFVIPIFMKSIYMIITSLLISGVGIGLSLPSLDALITEGIEKEERGTITSLYSSLRFVGVAAGPPTFAFLMKKPDNYMLFLSIILAVIGVILAIKFIKPKQEPEPVTQGNK